MSICLTKKITNRIMFGRVFPMYFEMCLILHLGYLLCVNVWMKVNVRFIFGNYYTDGRLCCYHGCGIRLGTQRDIRRMGCFTKFLRSGFHILFLLSLVYLRVRSV